MNKDFSANFKGIWVLFELFRKVKQKEVQYLKQLYLQSAERFEECVDFLLLIKLVNLNSGYIELSPSLSKFLFDRQNENQTKEFLINKLLSKRNAYVWEYLEKFSIVNDNYLFEPQISENLKFSNLRNLFIELEFIYYNPDQKNYGVTEKYIPLFVDLIKEHTISPDRLKEIIEEQEKIGKYAELEIIKYEKFRLSSRQDLLSLIEHKSLKDASAGYDIKSFTLNCDASFSERFIEVKAISKLKKKFFITRNELQFSKKQGMNYYLYLVPVIGRIKFDLDNLIIIQNPSNNIFNSNEWVVECAQFSIDSKENDVDY